MITRSKLMAASEAAGELGNRLESVSDLPHPTTTAHADPAVDPTFMSLSPHVHKSTHVGFRISISTTESDILYKEAHTTV